MPESRYHEFSSYSFFTENQSSLLLLGSHRAWGAIATSLAILEETKSFFKPQLLLQASANASFRINEKRDTLLTETIDARVGLLVNFYIKKNLKGSFGWMHQSGHVSDNVIDTDLFGSNLGDEILFFRVMTDIVDTARLGLSLKPIISSDPKIKTWASDQYIEWFPRGTQTEHDNALTPYFAIGLEESGVQQIEFSAHFQIGSYIGSHQFMHNKPSLRFTLGFYHGLDPRLKYAHFKLSKVNFGYVGVMLNI